MRMLVPPMVRRVSLAALLALLLVRRATSSGNSGGQCGCDAGPTCSAKAVKCADGTTKVECADDTIKEACLAVFNQNTTSGSEDDGWGKSACEEAADGECEFKWVKSSGEKWKMSKKNHHSSECCDVHYAVPSCSLLAGFVAKSLQGLLALAGIGSLLVKKKLEEAKTGKIRPYKVWALDVAKQAASGTCAHFNGIITSWILNETNDFRTDECSWYLLTFTLDTVRPLTPCLAPSSSGGVCMAPGMNSRPPSHSLAIDADDFVLRRRWAWRFRTTCSC
jgi:hypothetical protein